MFCCLCAGTAYSGPGDKDATGFNACGFGRLDSQWERMYGELLQPCVGECAWVLGLPGRGLVAWPPMPTHPHLKGSEQAIWLPAWRKRTL